MKYRKLRIAWSVAWGVAAVILIILWIRTRYAIDMGGGTIGSFQIGFMSRSGGLGFVFGSSPTPLNWSFSTMRPQEVPFQYKTIIGVIEYATESNSFRVRFPYWLLLACSMATATISWLSLKRFSLRTLLITTTLVAVGLRVIVWMAR
jgi:hypothetical protein